MVCGKSDKMCEMQKLRASVEQILTAAAEEIFGVFKRSITEIEEKLNDSLKHNKRNQRLPAVYLTDILQGHRRHVDQEDPEPPHMKEDQEEEETMNLTLLPECPTLVQKLWTVKEELPVEQQERSPSLDQVDPEPPLIKEEENLWTNQEGEQLQGLEEADITKFPLTPHCMKSKCDEDKAQFSQLYQNQTEETKEEPEDEDDYGESNPDSIQNDGILISDVARETTQHQYSEDDETCKFLSVSETQMTVHTTKMPFICSICHKGFPFKSKFNDHMLVHTGEKPFSCPVCRKCFSQKSNLNKHMLVHTREKRFRCSLCNKGFARKFEIEQHMPVHTREKPFSCSVCNKRFAHKSNLSKHMSVHTGERPFRCSVCSKSFALKTNLWRHNVTHTRQMASNH